MKSPHIKLVFLVAVISIVTQSRISASIGLGITRLGCYTDGVNRDLPEVHNGGKNTNRRYCWTYCLTRGYPYFGLQGGAWCTCGHSYGRYGRLDDSECNYKCWASASETCGASMRNEIFTTGVEWSDQRQYGSWLGCFNDGVNRDLPELHKVGSLASRSYCWHYCKYRHYRYFGLQAGEYCTCGNSYGRYGKASDGFCYMSCSGESGTTCGGGMKNELFSVSSSFQLWSTSSVLMGCFKDRADRDLPLVHYAGPATSRQYCWDYCTTRGYRYFGLQSGAHCTCGNRYGKYEEVDRSECSKTCAGERGQTCGSDNRSEVFLSGIVDWERDTVRIGCFEDSEKRDLPVVVNLGDRMSKFSCWTYCRSYGYKYFGLQSGILCCCGNAYGRYGRVRLSECNSPCKADHTTKCGGSWRNEIYTTGIGQLPRGTSSRIGCFRDESEENRDLQLVHRAGVATSRVVCSDYCRFRGYMYFGLQASQLCTCGNQFGRYGQVSNRECSLSCPNKIDDTCGHRLRNEIFNTGLAQWDSAVIRMGCFLDKANRDMPELLKTEHLTSKFDCWTYCRSIGYKYFGLQSAAWCTCGNEFGRYGQVPDSECNQNCRGDPTVTCGGPMRNEVFTTGIDRWDANVTRLGCFIDEEYSRDLKLVRNTGSDTRRKHCWHFCHSRGYRYFGLQSGDLCTCGNSFGRHGQADDSECNIRCRGYDNETCGGTRRNEIYTTGQWNWDLPVRSLGCFAGSPLVRHRASGITHRYYCWSYCQSQGFNYFGMEGDSVCICDSTLERYTRKMVSLCNVACSGDNSTNCGGRDGLKQMFTTGAGMWELQASYFGCFEDNGQRRAPLAHNINQFIDDWKRYCWHYCRSRSYRYFAMRSESTCICGNYHDRYGLVRREECAEECMGSVRMSCRGESSWTKVFNTGLEAWEQNVTRLGCFKDNNSNHDLPVEIDAGNSLTKKFCWIYCKARGHKYFGLQNGRYCYCGSSYGRYGKADDSECSERCRGDTSTTCGGELHNEVFGTGLEDWELVSATTKFINGYERKGNVTRVGCVKRATELYMVLNHDMGNLATRYLCWKRCASFGYKYFGLHDGQMCTCGNKLIDSNRAYYRCDLNCKGDRRTTCGGAMHSEVFTTGLEDSWRYKTTSKGCFIDDPADPDVGSELHHLGEAATKRACWSRCRSLRRRYFALQASQWCACGDSYGRHGNAKFGECRLPCLGDPSDTCGGHLRNEVFSTGI